MATLTAQILVGHGHPNHDGINPTHQLYFSENSNYAWILVPENVFGREKSSEKIVWVTSGDKALEDGLLMAAVHVIEDKEIARLTDGYLLSQSRERVELYNDALEAHLDQLREKVRKLSGEFKIVVTTLKGSVIESQLPVIEKYSMDVEVCVPVYSRLYDRWNNQTKTEGSL